MLEKVVIKKLDRGEKCNMRIRVKEEVMEEIVPFRYLWVEFAANWRTDAKLNYRLTNVRKCARVLKSTCKHENLLLKNKRCMYKGIIVLTALYGM